jgi:uncharacterized circularly permuted ATP-grasp superfamily protein/uncharacterized alpha-E superfamily protein
MAFDALRYAPAPGGYDEVVAADGSLRPPWQQLERALGSFDAPTLIERHRQAGRLLDAEGTGHLVHDGHASESRPWRLDPLPFVIDAPEFDTLAAGAVQRMRAVEALLDDLYGTRRLVTEGRLPAAVLFSLPSFRPATGGPGKVARWLTHWSVDVVRDASGGWRVVQGSGDVPTGVGYAMLNRAVLARLVGEGLRAVDAAGIHDHADVLRRALAATAGGTSSPRTVVLTPGPDSDAYVEHSYLASRLGLHLVQGADVVMREGRLWLRALDGLEPIDVVYRRIGDAHLDPLEAGHVGGGVGVPGIVWGATGGGVMLANAYGTAIADTAAFASMLPVVASEVLGERLLLDDLPDGAALATSPAFDASSATTRPAPVVLRLHVTRHDDDYVVLRGGVGRVLADGDHPTRPSARLAKDVWVLGGARTGRAVAVTHTPQVDFGGSVPTRVADSMYWLGRAAERAEFAVRSARVVAQQLDLDPLLVTAGDGTWSSAVAALLAAARSTPVDVASAAPPAERVAADLAATSKFAATQLLTLVHEAGSVREYLSATTGRVLGRIAHAQVRLADADASTPAAPDELDGLLVDLAALSGLATESTVRGPAWRFLDMGRRLERALAVLSSVEAGLGLAVAPMALQPVADVVLASNESLVAYRRRYRSDTDLHAVIDMLVHDDANPRSVAYQLDRLREHAAGLTWADGQRLVHDASVGALGHPGSTVVSGRRIDVDALVLAVRGSLLELAEAVVQRWFADPVHPALVRGR